MENGLTENNARLNKGDWFDCPNCCDVKTVDWITGEAYCTECGLPGVVYPASVMKRAYPQSFGAED